MKRFTPRHKKHAAVAAAALAVVGGLGLSAYGQLSINLILDPASSSPLFDPAASGLTSIMNEAARQWEDIIEDTHTLDITYGWAPVAAPDIALHTFTGYDPLSLRQTSGLIQFDTGQTWFIDPTPSDNSEFTMSQALHYPPVGGVVERGFTGTGGVTTNLDLLTVALREIGHALGMSAGSVLTMAETSDGDYDTPADLYNGTTMAIQHAAAGDIEHLLQANALLAPGLGPGTRKLPSAIDVMALAAASSWSDIDLQRQDFIAGTDTFNNASHWIGNQVPGRSDTAYVRDGQDAQLKQSSVAVGELIIEQNADVEIGEVAASTLTVVGDTTVLDSGSIWVHELGVLSTDKLIVGSSGVLRSTEQVTLTGGQVDADVVKIGHTGSLNLYGTVNADTVKNNGRIEAYDGTLTINANDEIDLDGPANTGRVEAGRGGALSGDLVINAPVSDFAGMMWVREASSITFNESWTLADLSSQGGPRGRIHLDDGGDIHGSESLTIGGDLIVSTPNGVADKSTVHMDLDVLDTGTLDFRGNARLPCSFAQTYTHPLFMAL